MCDRKIFNELINEFVKNQTFQQEIENLRIGSSDALITQSHNPRMANSTLAAKSMGRNSTGMAKSMTINEKDKKANQKNNMLRKMNALNFFSRLIRSGDKEVYYLLRSQFVFQALETVFEEDPDLRILYRDTYNLIKNIN